MAINLLPMATQNLLWQVTRNENARTDAERDALLNSPDLGFGKTFTDHMVDICWSEHGGWHRPRVRPYGPIELDPAAAVLHYAQEVFEGLKAYRHADGSIWTFRPEQNAARMQTSARRRRGRRWSGPPAVSPCQNCPPSTSSSRSSSSWPSMERGCRVPPRPACTCGRSCSPKRRSSGSGPRPRSTTT